MQITGVDNLQLSISGSVLRSANEQPQLASELINKAVEGMRQTQNLQSPAQPVAVSGKTTTGTIINTTA